MRPVLAIVLAGCAAVAVAGCHATPTCARADAALDKLIRADFPNCSRTTVLAYCHPTDITVECVEGVGPTTYRRLAPGVWERQVTPGCF